MDRAAGRHGRLRLLWPGFVLLACLGLLSGDLPFAAGLRCLDRVLVPSAASAYPWQGVQSPSARDRFGFTARQCTSFAAWFLTVGGLAFGRTLHGPAGFARLGDADGWDAAARQAGFPVSTTPRIGSIAQWHANETSPNGCLTAGRFGHVAVVVRVHPDQTVDTVAYDGTTRRFDYEEDVVAPRYIDFEAPGCASVVTD